MLCNVGLDLFRRSSGIDRDHLNVGDIHFRNGVQSDLEIGKRAEIDQHGDKAPHGDLALDRKAAKRHRVTSRLPVCRLHGQKPVRLR